MEGYEKDHIYPVALAAGDFTAQGMLRPCAVLDLIQHVCEEHIASFGVDTFTMLQKKVAWVLVAAMWEQEAIPEGCLKLQARTWHSQVKGPYFRREVELCTEEGQRVIAFTSYSIVMDMEKRAMLRPSALPYSIPAPEPDFLLSWARPKAELPAELIEVEQRQVRPSETDLLGHVNNSRYADYAFDGLLPDERTRAVRAVEINFHSELKAGQVFTLKRGTDGDGHPVFAGFADGAAKHSFLVKFTWK